MGQKKLIRFAELLTFSNVLQKPEGIKGNWHSFFNNDHPLTLELACGKGEYTVGLGRLHPQRNFVGIDIKGNRIWVGAKKALQENLTHVGFLRSQIEKLETYFAPKEVSEIWITFPDPQLRLSKAKKRLTHPRFLRVYQAILKENGIIHLKTDSPDLYRFTKTVIALYGCSIIQDYDDLYSKENLSEDLKIKTHYEGLDIAQSNKIFYLSFTLPHPFPGEERDADLKEAIKYELDRG